VLYQISEDGSLKVGTDAMSRAIQLTRFLCNCLNTVLEKCLVFSRDMREKNRIFELIKKEPDIDRSRLLRYAHVNADKLNIYIRTLREENLISQRTEGKTTHYYPIEFTDKK
jgi:predicted transcriptional regulator